MTGWRRRCRHWASVRQIDWGSPGAIFCGIRTWVGSRHDLRWLCQRSLGVAAKHSGIWDGTEQINCNTQELVLDSGVDLIGT